VPIHPQKKSLQGSGSQPLRGRVELTNKNKLLKLLLALGAFTIKENAWQLFDGEKRLLVIFREHLVKVLRAL
jgi:hypothetical protein